MAIRCIKCSTSSKVTRLTETGWHCPGCGHRFTANPRVDGVSDAAIEQSLDIVTAGGTRKYLLEQLAYEIGRRRGRRRFLAFVRQRPVVAFVVPAVVLPVLYLADVPGVAVTVIGALVYAVLVLRLLTWPRPVNGMALARRFEEINPSGCLVPEGDGDAAAEPARMPALGDRVLVCQHRRVVDWLHANSFHLHHACAVIGPSGHGAGHYPGLAAHLRAHPALRVLVLHDLSPAGRAFARQVAGNPEWLGFGPDARVVDVGLHEDHRAHLGRELRPVSEFRMKGARGTLTRDSREPGIELVAVPAVLLLTAVGTSVDDGVPMVLAAAAATGGSGGSSGDSGG